MGEAHENALAAASAIHALAKGEDTDDAFVGAYLVGEFMALVRSFLTGK